MVTVGRRRGGWEQSSSAPPCQYHAAWSLLAPAQPANANAVNKIALQQDDQDYSGRHRNGASSHLIVKFNRELPMKLIEPKRDGGHVHALQDNQRPEEIIPVAHERK